MKKVFMIAYGFPPIGGPAVQRSAKFAKNLPKLGWEPHVFTIDERSGHVIDPSLMEDIPKTVKTYRYFSWDMMYFYNALQKFKLGVLCKILDRKILIPDGKFLWYLFNRKKARDIMAKEKMDILYSSGAPWSTHLMALWLKNFYPELPWVADFRDEWTNNPHTLEKPYSWIRRKIEKRWERKVLERADFVIANTPLMMKNFIEICKVPKEKIHSISNGFDIEDFGSFDRELKTTEKCIVTYTGAFYGKRHPNWFLEAIGNLVREGKVQKEDLEIRFIGEISSKNIKDKIDKEGLKDVVKIYPYMKHKDSIHMLLQSTLLLFIVGSEIGSKVFYSGKLFEYLYANRPILGCVPIDGVAADLIEKTDTGLICETEDVRGIEKNFYTYYKQWKEGSLVHVPREEVIMQYERKELTKSLVDIFEKLLKTSM